MKEIDKRNNEEGYKDEKKHQRFVSNIHFLHDIETHNPLSIKFKKYWREMKRRCMEGYWHEGKWMPGNLYMYVNFCKIKLNKDSFSTTKIIAKPFLRDLEWEKAYVYAEARGFSGFRDDPDVTCLLIVKEINGLENTSPEEWKELYNIPEDAYKADGSLKTYEPARKYLRKIHAKNLGKPLYQNTAFNVIDVECRGSGKSFWAADGLVLHNFYMDGCYDYDEYWESIQRGEGMTSETLVGAIDGSYTKDLLDKVETSMENFGGQQLFQGQAIPSPLSKGYTGSWYSGKQFVIAKTDKKVNGQWKRVGSGALIHNRSFKDNPHAGNGTRPSLTCFEEVGFMSNLKDSLAAMKDTTYNGPIKFGTIYMFGCVCAGTKVWNHEGREVNIEDLQQVDGICGYEGQGVTKEPIIWMKPPAKKPCYRIETRGGDYLECSDDHPLLWSKNHWDGKYKKVTFKRADELKVGDQLMQVHQMPIFGKAKAPHPRLLGLLIGDGYYGGRSVEVSLEGEDLYNWLNENYNIHVDKQFITKDGFTYRRANIKGFQQTMRDIGLFGQRKETKHLPANMHNYDMHSVTELIGGYFDADGTVKLGKSQRITLTSKYLHLLEEVNTLLYKLGIDGCIVKEYRKGGFKPGVIYRLYIHQRQSIVMFQKHIKFIDSRKQAKLMKMNTNNGRGFYKECQFVKSESTTKGEYYLDRDSTLKNLTSNFITKIEYIGEQEVYNLNAGTTHTYITNKFVSGNTGGAMESGASEAARDVFNDPDTYDCLCFQDVWEDAGDIGYFVPYELGLNDFKDDEGNTKMEQATKWVDTRRNKLAQGKSKQPLYKEMQNNPRCPSEAFLSKTSNIFPVPELKAHLGWLKSRMETDAFVQGQCGELVWELVEGREEAILKWRPDLDNKLKPCHYGIKKGDDTTGCVQIWEQPQRDGSGEIPPLLYIAGTDPYDQDQSVHTASLGSTFIYKTFNGVDKLSEIPVAEYTARPATAAEHHENIRKLLLYYNARDLYENERNTLKMHFEHKYSLYLLAKTPTILKATEGSKVDRQYGIHMTAQIKDELEIYTRDWLQEESQDGKLNLHKINSPALLEELIYYNRDGNFDRVIAFMLTVCHRLANYNKRVEQNTEKEVKMDPFFERAFNGGFYK